jgi:hypothetical protein
VKCIDDGETGEGTRGMTSARPLPFGVVLPFEGI